ncbi:lachesin-like [Tachypleus tridentatus]|uniref:lachesin-like n=1 Tax=Tachypleus tridentatus TaxID=6853 RepID=UPI003FD09F59
MNSKITALVFLLMGMMSNFQGHCNDLMPRFSEPIPNITVPVGRDIEFPCIVENLGNYRAAWLKIESKAILSIHQNLITRNYRISLSHSDNKNFVLHLKNVQKSDVGSYMCQLNTVPMMSQVGHLDVLFPPEINLKSSSPDELVREGSNVTFSCLAKGYPTPKVTWRREDDRPILIQTSDGTTQYMDTHEGEHLALVNINREHSGAYLCIAVNGVPPSVSKRLMLYVEYSPAITVPNGYLGAELKTTAVLACVIDSFPSSRIYWVKGNGTGLNSGKKYDIRVRPAEENKIEGILRIHNLQKIDLGVYKCLAKNLVGIAVAEIYLYELQQTTTTTTTTTSESYFSRIVTTPEGGPKNISDDDDSTAITTKLGTLEDASIGEYYPLYEDASNIQKEANMRINNHGQSSDSYSWRRPQLGSSMYFFILRFLLATASEVIT